MNPGIESLGVGGAGGGRGRERCAGSPSFLPDNCLYLSIFIPPLGRPSHSCKLRVPADLQGLQTDYFIDCVYNQDEQRLYLVGGSDDGNVHISHVNVVRKGALSLAKD